MSRPRKSSAYVSLVLLGAAALAGCSDNSGSGRRAAYATKEACLADWGDPKECEEQQTTDGNGGSTRYWGHYGGGSSGGYHPGGSSNGSSSHSISHGGFGSHGSSSS